ncbi:hypothetical protein IMCC3317_03200 [Kordia antarctica]|uniref:BLUF domain-containing protein n=1 Tax=Kordia antarctica TaxID=1218801 RepID=A0A7L4ZGC4_9FLAO|nr:BLUF domain-containing protein [Kordia antarctica]QHI34974.1 hypothetical protein IMCC3317_03200 [Kordia antarctica]
MYTLTYESTAVGKPSVEDMEHLMEKARANNAVYGITGCLVYYNGGFIQIIEGEKDDILTLFERIKLDPRHTDVHLFSDNNITERTFNGWGMPYFVSNENTTSRFEIEQFKNNISLLSDLSEKTNTTVLLFWRRIKLLLNNPAEEVYI